MPMKSSYEADVLLFFTMLCTQIYYMKYDFGQNIGYHLWTFPKQMGSQPSLLISGSKNE